MEYNIVSSMFASQKKKNYSIFQIIKINFVITLEIEKHVQSMSEMILISKKITESEQNEQYCHFLRVSPPTILSFKLLINRHFVAWLCFASFCFAHNVIGNCAKPQTYILTAVFTLFSQCCIHFGAHKLNTYK